MKSKGISIGAPFPPLSPLPNQKGISTIIAVVLLLLITIGIVWSTYTFLTSATGSVTKAGGKQIERTAEILSSCIKIESVGWNKVYVRNCGVKGKISNSSIAVFVDGIRVGHNMNPLEVDVDDVGEIELYGLWRFSLGEHELKVVSGGVMDEVAVRFKPHPSAVLVYTFDDDTIEGNKVIDLSGKGNDGIIYGAQLVDGKFGKALSFDGVDDYVIINGNEADKLLENSNRFTVVYWFKAIQNSVTYDYIWATGIGFSIPPSTTVEQNNNGQTYMIFRVRDESGNNYATSLSETAGKKPYNFGEWTFVTFYYDGDKIRGETISSLGNVYNQNRIGDKNLKFELSSYRIGDKGGGNNGAISVIIDQLMIFNKALPPDQIYWMEMV